jgi:hypothetical protein
MLTELGIAGLLSMFPPDPADIAGFRAAYDSSSAVADPTHRWESSAPDVQTGPWFYSGLPYGSESLIHPVRLIVNGGFGILQFDNRSNRLGSVDFASGWHRVWADVGNPRRAIGVEGWTAFMRREVLPISANRKDAQYWPNYTLHLVGGGMSYVTMREWYGLRGQQRPGLAAGMTLAAYHLLNEVVENDARPGPTTDAVSDLLLFDPAGILLFSHDGVARFFGKRLHMRDWSSQPAIDPAAGTIENQGQNFSIKVGLPSASHWSFFYYFGNHGEVGLTHTRPNGSAFSAGGGFRAKSLVKRGPGSQTVTLVPSYGFFYDRNGSLMFSVTGAKTSRYQVRVNAYPGLLRLGRWSPGLFALLGRDGDIVLGLHLTCFPVGLAGRLQEGP